MDCIEARVKIDLYIDGELDDAEKQRLIWHASSCPQCKKALDDAIKLKKALTDLEEVEPPAGLAAAAIKKAKRRRIPMYAYASAAAAAVVALLLIFSPTMLPKSDFIRENAAAPELMYSAEEADSAVGEKAACGSVASEEAGVAAAPDAQDGLGGEMIEMTAQASIDASTEIRVYRSEKEFYIANSQAADTEYLTTLYRLISIPEGAELQKIEVNDYSVRWVYCLPDSGTLVFEWLRAHTAEEIREWNALTQLLSDNLAHSFQQSGDVFWSGEARFNGSGEMVATDSAVIHAYWTQDGAAFHAELPMGFTEEQILASCAAEAVPAG